MADYKEMLGALVNKARNAMDGSGVAGVYQKGAERAKTYGRIAKLTMENKSQAEELRKVFTEIGKLYYEQAREKPEGFFAPLFAQAAQLQEGLRARDAELAALKEGLSAAAEEKDIEVEITEEVPDFEAVVDATATEGKGEDA